MAAHTARFHRLVLESAHNHVLLEFGEQLSLRSRWFFAPLVSSIAPRAWDEHWEVAQLIVSGHADEAAEAMRAHVRVSLDTYLSTQPVSDGDTGELPVPAAPAPAAPPPTAAVPPTRGETWQRVR